MPTSPPPMVSEKLSVAVSADAMLPTLPASTSISTAVLPPVMLSTAAPSTSTRPASVTLPKLPPRRTAAPEMFIFAVVFTSAATVSVPRRASNAPSPSSVSEESVVSPLSV